MNVRKLDGTILVTLSRRNLKALLLKLDEPISHRTLVRRTESGFSLVVKAEEDNEHYAEREAGAVHPREEERL